MQCVNGCDSRQLLLFGDLIHFINPITFTHSEGVYFYYECIICHQTIFHSVEIKYDHRVKADCKRILKGFISGMKDRFTYSAPPAIQWEKI
jgi:hypothetical protein